MSQALILAFLFFMGCIIGWGLEVFYRRFKKSNTSRRWVNPGFLVGPYLPIYGVGLCGLYLLASLENTHLIVEVSIGSKLLLFLLMAVIMTLVEYIAGVIFIKGMRVQLWDYSNERFNFQGIICLRFSIYWALLGALYYFLIHPRILEALEWLSQNLQFSFFVGAFFGVFAVDVAYSLNLVTRIRTYAKENDVLVRYEALRMQIQERAEERREKIHWFLRFHSEHPFAEHLREYVEREIATLNDPEKLEEFIKAHPIK